MLEKFNRCEIFMTYDVKNLQKVKQMLDHVGIDYVEKTTIVHEVNDSVTNAKNYQTFFYDYSVGYKLYVNRNDADEAMRYIHIALFPEDAY